MKKNILKHRKNFWYIYVLILYLMGQGLSCLVYGGLMLNGLPTILWALRSDFMSDVVVGIIPAIVAIMAAYSAYVQYVDNKKREQDTISQNFQQ